jgi:hypothetical protein
MALSETANMSSCRGLAAWQANRKTRGEIKNHQMFETDPESFSPAIYFIYSGFF